MKLSKVEGPGFFFKVISSSNYVFGTIKFGFYIIELFNFNIKGSSLS